MKFWLIDLFDGMGFVWKWIFYAEGLFISLAKTWKKTIFSNDLSVAVACHNDLSTADILTMVFYWDLGKTQNNIIATV